MNRAMWALVVAVVATVMLLFVWVVLDTIRDGFRLRAETFLGSPGWAQFRWAVLALRDAPYSSTVQATMLERLGWLRDQQVPYLAWREVRPLLDEVVGILGAIR